MLSRGLVYMHEIIFSLIFKMIHMLLTKTKLNIFYNVALFLLLRDHLFHDHDELHGSELYMFKKVQ